MKEINLVLNSNDISDKPIRNILGMNNSPRIIVKDRLAHDKEIFEGLNLKFVRHHDATLENPSLQLVDVQKIFPLFHLDENNPDNYFFGHTDDYFNEIKDLGGEIEFRIGETIDHTGHARFINPPKDVNKWARICRNIIAHYKSGEFNGMNLNITRVCILEEPDNEKLFTGNVNEYFEMFSALYKLLRKDFPDLKIGGPTTSFHANEFFTEFLKLCKKNGVQPDFITYTVYLETVEEVIETIREKQKIIKECGFDDIPISLSEWHVAPPTWDMADPRYSGSFNGTYNASFSASLLIKLTDTIMVDNAYYYAFMTGSWSVSGTDGLLPVYYGLKFFQKIATECNKRLEIFCDEKDLSVLSGKTDNGKVRLLISCCKTEEYKFKIKTDLKSCKLLSVFPDFKEEECLKAKPLDIINGELAFNHRGESGVYLLEFE